MNLHTRMAMKQEVPDDVQPEIAVAMAPRPAGAWVEGFDSEVPLREHHG